MLGRRTIRLLAVAAVLGAGVPGRAAKGPKGAPLTRLPGQSAEIEDLLVPPASQECFNWSWATAIETMLRAQKVETLTQGFFIRKIYPGDLCVDTAVDYERLSRAVDGDYVLDAGHKVRLHSRFTPGAPTIPDEVIGPLRQGRPLLLFWKARAYVLYGAIYDEYIYPNGQRMFQIRELKLVDPLGKDGERLVSFVNGQDDPAEIEGIFEVRAEELQEQPWVR